MPYFCFKELKEDFLVSNENILQRVIEYWREDMFESSKLPNTQKCWKTPKQKSKLCLDSATVNIA